jgi:phenylacetate-coenzyme A ligase PaaK-like adenylate-forming protein
MRKIFIILCIFIFSCQDKEQPKNLVPFDKMKIVLYQLMKADEYYTRSVSADTAMQLEKKNIQFYKQIFELNKVDRNDFFETLTYLQKRPIEFKELMDSTYELSKREKLQLNVH